MAETIGYNRNKKISSRMSKETEERFSSAQSRLTLGQNYRQHEREPTWNDSFDLYMGDSWNVNPDDPTADIVNVNIAFSTINTLVPFVADEDPSFLVSPYSGDATQENAVLLQSFLNRMWKSTDMRGQQHLSDAVFDYLLYGDGYIKAGYNIQEKEIFDELGERVRNRIQVGKFFIERINPWDVWIDPYSDGIHNARWVCQRIILPVQELVNDDRYKVRSTDDIESGAIDSHHLSPEDRDRLDEVDTSDWVAIYEFYDRVLKKNMH